MSNGKGDRRREEDRKRIAENWPFKRQKPKELKEDKGKRE